MSSDKCSNKRKERRRYRPRAKSLGRWRQRLGGGGLSQGMSGGKRQGRILR